MVRKYREAKELTKAMEEMFVERVEVYDGEHIKMRWKFNSDFSKSKKSEGEYGDD